MASTAIPAVKAALVELLEASEDLQGVTVTDDKEPERSDEYVWIWKAKSHREYRLLGGKPPPLDEDLEVKIRIVAIKGDASKPSEERATELLEAVEDALRADLGLKQTVLWHKLEDIEGDPVLFDTRRGFAWMATLTAKARI